MKILRNQSQRGGVLVVTILVCALVGLMLVAYLAMVSGQHTFTQRSQVWNNCIPMCESGVEEALAHINHINTTSNFAINGWVFQSGAYRKQRTNQGVATMAVDTNMPPIITVQGSLRSPITAGYLTRTVRVKTKMNQRFPNGILSKGTVTLGGSGRIDSFNSTIPGESGPNGQYVASNATDRATVATTAGTAGAVNVGNMSIYGSVGTGAGGTVLLNANGNVGSAGFNDDPAFNGRIENGHRTDDINVYIADGALPIPFGPVSTPSPGSVGGVNYVYVVPAGDWQLPAINLASSQKILIAAKARLYVLGTTIVGGSASIVIATNASLELYARGNVDIRGAGVVNSPGVAKNFSIIGLNSCSSVYYGGGAQFVGTIYAPYAAVSLAGNTDAYGAIVGRTFSLTGTMGLHYDEALKGDPREGRFLAASWQEL